MVVGRPALMEELIAGPADVRGFIAEQTAKLLLSGVASDIVAGALPDARFLPRLVPDAVDLLGAISRLRWFADADSPQGQRQHLRRSRAAGC